VPEEFPVIHFRDALAELGAELGEPVLTPAHDRALGRLTGAENIREVTLFPRDLNRLAP
jgi:hypothetical protein